MKRTFAVFVAIVAVAVLSGCGSNVVSSTLSDAATMRYTLKGEERTLHVTRARLLSELRALVNNEPFAEFLNSQTPSFEVSHDLSANSRLAAIWLTQLIQQATIDELFETRDLRVSADLRRTAAADAGEIFPDAAIFPAFSAKFRATMTDRTARSEALLASYTDTSDAAGREYFRLNAAEFGCPSGKNIAHILVPTQAAAQTIVDQVTAGGSFATIAKEKSTDTESGAAGGLLGCLTAEQFVPAFQQAADAATVGTPTAPVKTEFGYHVILVTKAAATTYEDVKAQVAQALQQEGSRKLAAAVNALYEKYKVRVDPRFGTWGSADDGQGGTTYRITEPPAPTPATSREGTTTTTLPAAPNGSP